MEEAMAQNHYHKQDRKLGLIICGYPLCDRRNCAVIRVAANTGFAKEQNNGYNKAFKIISLSIPF